MLTLQVEEASRISEIFLDVRKMKKLRKEAILDRFNQRAAVLGQGRQAKDQVTRASNASSYTYADVCATYADVC
jgi:hypothetical protein